jgi:O-antigen/teichoic acid export membrane protein
MNVIRRLRAAPGGVLLGNVAARFAALASLALATLVVARSGGPAAVGVYVLLRVLPSLIGVVSAAGLPGSVAFFLAGPHRDDRRLPLTLVSIALTGGTAGAVLWVAASPLLGRFLFPDLPSGLVMLAAVLVLTRAVVATAKSCSQGSHDLPGANRVIFTEEFMFLPAYGVVLATGARGFTAVVLGLILADLATLSLAWGRLIRRRFFERAMRPSRQLSRTIISYGMRAQVGGVISLMNLRLDFILLSLLTGPALLGVYAVASKFAELVHVLGLSLTYVLYPRFAREGRAEATASARKLIPKAGLLTAAAVVPLWLSAGFVIPHFYGSAFAPAIVPAQIILLGLTLDGVGGVITAFLYGTGRPGLNSWAMGVGLAATLALDFVLIPPYGATGAAVASAVAYVTSAVALVGFFWWMTRAKEPLTSGPSIASADAG